MMVACIIDEPFPIEIFGAKLGAYSRNDRLTTEDFEMLVVASKKG